MNHRYRIIVTLLPLTLAMAACDQRYVPNLFNPTFLPTSLSDAMKSKGIKETLRVAVARAAETLSQPGGFANNDSLRLKLPENLGPLVDAMRSMGLEHQIGSLEPAMNRAAEMATKQAARLFASAISSMTIDNVLQIVNGPNDAATQYFKDKTSDTLRQKFAPTVSETMRELGLHDTYQQMVETYNAIPNAKPVPDDLVSYVTDQTLEGLFKVLSEEEARIRADPAARTSKLMRRLFAAAKKPTATSPEAPTEYD